MLEPTTHLHHKVELTAPRLPDYAACYCYKHESKSNTGEKYVTERASKDERQQPLLCCQRNTAHVLQQTFLQLERVHSKIAVSIQNILVTVVCCHYQVSCTVHDWKERIFIQLALQWICLQQHHHKYMSNMLCYDVIMAMTSPNRNFSAAL